MLGWDGQPGSVIVATQFHNEPKTNEQNEISEFVKDLLGK